MEWTKDDTELMQTLVTNIEFDEIKIKDQIKKSLLKNRFIIHALHNEELEKQDAEPDDYFNVNILPFYQIMPVQSNVQNFLCFEVRFDSFQKGNSLIKEIDITFTILCEQKDLIDEETGVARHDLLGALLQDWFNYTNELGIKIHCVSNVPSVVDQKYACRTLVFRQIGDNAIIKTRTGADGKRTPFIANRTLVYPSEQI